MKDNRLFVMFNQLDTSNYASEQENLERIYQLSLSKCNIKTPATSKYGKLLLVAAILAGALIAIAAGYFTASDALREYLRELGPDGEPQNLSSLAPVVDQTGQALSNEQNAVSATDEQAVAGSSTYNGLVITPEAVAGDENILLLLLDIANQSDDPLGIAQADGTVSTGRVSFEAYLLNSEGQRLMGGVQILDSSIKDGHAKVFVRFNINEEIFSGESVRIVLRNLLQTADLPTEDVAISTGDFYSMVKNFPAATESDFAQMGYYSDADGNITGYDYHLITDSGLSLQLGGVMQGYTITNAAIRENKLYLRLYAPDQEMSRWDTVGMAIQTKDGVIPHYSFGVDPNTSAGNPGMGLNLIFDGVQSVEQLQDAELVSGYGDIPHLLAEGQWELDIPLNYKSVSVEKAPNQAMVMNNRKVTIEKIITTPYQLTLSIIPEETDQETLGNISDYFIDHYVTIHYKDGSEYVLKGIGIGGSPEYYDETFPENPQVERIWEYLELPVIIDPREIQSISIGNINMIF